MPARSSENTVVPSSSPKKKKVNPAHTPSSTLYLTAEAVERESVPVLSLAADSEITGNSRTESELVSVPGNIKKDIVIPERMPKMLSEASLDSPKRRSASGTKKVSKLCSILIKRRLVVRGRLIESNFFGMLPSFFSVCFSDFLFF